MASSNHSPNNALCIITIGQAGAAIASHLLQSGLDGLDLATVLTAGQSTPPEIQNTSILSLNEGHSLNTALLQAIAPTKRTYLVFPPAGEEEQQLARELVQFLTAHCQNFSLLLDAKHQDRVEASCSCVLYHYTSPSSQGESLRIALAILTAIKKENALRVQQAPKSIIPVAKLTPQPNRANAKVEACYMSICGSEQMVDNSIIAERAVYSECMAPDFIRTSARYMPFADNHTRQSGSDPLVTFSLNGSTGAYSNVRRFLREGALPPTDAVRVEELINYFPWKHGQHLAEQMGNSPFWSDYALFPCPWDWEKTLLCLNVRAGEVATEKLPAANLVFLVDTSGSMCGAERLELAKKALLILADSLREQDRISIVSYSGRTELVLENSSGADKAKIHAAINSLYAAGCTAGGQALEMAYTQLGDSFIPGGVNRIFLCTDGDFNVGATSDSDLTALVKRKRDKGATLSVLGFGTDNYNESMLMQIADCGNGNYSYIDSLAEAQKVLGDELRATMISVACDVKVLVEFNPNVVQEHRQIGYEVRQLRPEDFNNDKVGAAYVGSGKSTTVLFELSLAGQKRSLDPLRYQQPDNSKAGEPFHDRMADELAFVKLRWKDPSDTTAAKNASKLESLPILRDRSVDSLDETEAEFLFYAAVAAFGQKLRGLEALNHTSWKDIADWASKAAGNDPINRGDFLRLVQLAATVEG